MRIRQLDTLLISVMILLLTSCEPQVDHNTYTQADITMTFNNGIKKGKQEAIDSIAAIPKPVIKKVEETPTQYYAADFNLPTGLVVDFSPRNESIALMHSAGGDKPDRQIYIHIKNAQGVITIHEVDYKTWLVVYTEAYLK